MPSDAGLRHVTFGRSSLAFVVTPCACGFSSVSLGRWPLGFSLGHLACPLWLLFFGLWALGFDTYVTAFDVRPKGFKRASVFVPMALVLDSESLLKVAVLVLVLVAELVLALLLLGSVPTKFQNFLQLVVGMWPWGLGLGCLAFCPGPPPVAIGRWLFGYRLWASLFKLTVCGVGLSISASGLASRATCRARVGSLRLAVAFGVGVAVCVDGIVGITSGVHVGSGLVSRPWRPDRLPVAAPGCLASATSPRLLHFASCSLGLFQFCLSAPLGPLASCAHACMTALMHDGMSKRAQVRRRGART